MLRISNYLRFTILPLRNQLSHNNQGTLCSRSKEDEIENMDNLEERNFITIQNGNIIEIPTTLADYFDVSEKTIRRDIAKLKDFGIRTRAYDQKVWKWIIKNNANQWL